ncbi:histidinol dehydrogenase [Sandaracinobacter sp. RS1-74]|uniref:histidinol dehydrogenase n=1 Tax=Sandaracinobacteroides sayramensis TaxID=2913411 RepID=UPI001EDA2CE4|nr:histidinol dehydrogenase [Sandaracinobacteroides sayramensis]MCG2839901.1 histidinol dehydrogenase [Sandaracinobacteroides sayramensis]
MMLRLRSADADFAARFAALVADTREPDRGVSGQVAAILERVRKEGFAAVAELTQRFDRVELTAGSAEVGRAERDAAVARVPAEARAALELAAARIRAFHEVQRPADGEHADATGVRAGWRWTAVERAGLYVPGGRAAYPSSVLMNAIPAQVAGVDELVMVMPTPDGRLNPLAMLAADLAGVSRIFRIGGAQAIAALAYGTAPVPKCDMIVGPGNAWVAEAKRQLYGTVGIDMVAGPSEILVIADASARPDWIAADLLSQAEHDPVAQSILITDSPTLADAVADWVERLLPALSTGEAARESWDNYGAIILVRDLAEAAPLANALAAEHLELMLADPKPLFEVVRHAGSIFLGAHTPEPVGDYIGGPNHVLPTGRRARFSGGLGVHNFLKRTTWLEAGADGFAALAHATATLADAEGLPAHALSIRIRARG